MTKDFGDTVVLLFKLVVFNFYIAATMRLQNGYGDIVNLSVPQSPLNSPNSSHEVHAHLYYLLFSAGTLHIQSSRGIDPQTAILLFS